MGTYLLAVLIFVGLCAAWAGVQLLARKMGTKNHIDDGYTCCGNCEKQCWVNEEDEKISQPDIQEREDEKVKEYFDPYSLNSGPSHRL